MSKEEEEEAENEQNEDLLDNVEEELSQLERALQAPRQWLRGRAQINSIGDSLANVGRRLQRSLTPSSAAISSSSSTDDAQENTTTTTTGGEEEGTSSLRALSRRLETAQLAFSSRTPLDVVLQRQQQQGQQQQQQPQYSQSTSALPPLSSSGSQQQQSLRSTFTVSTPGGGGGGGGGQGRQSTRRSSQRRPSLLLASRNRNAVSQPDLFSMEHYEAGGSVVVQVGLDSTSTSTHVHNKRQSALDVLKEDELDLSANNNSEKEEETTTNVGKDDSSNETDTSTTKRKASILLNKSQSETLTQLLSDSTVSGSIQPPPQPQQQQPQQQQQQQQQKPQQQLAEEEEIAPPEQQQEEIEEKPTITSSNILYSWGLTGLVSLHDDDTPRTVPADSLVGPDSRLGKPNSKAVVSFATSSTHSACALASRGSVLTWGQQQQQQNQQQDEVQQSSSRPTLFEAINNFNLQISQVSCGYNHTAALSTLGTCLTWGYNDYGQLGHRTTATAQRQQQQKTYCNPQGLVLRGGQRAASIACGYYFTLILTTRMNVLACGDETITGCCSSIANATSSATVTDGANHRFSASAIPALQALPLIAVAAGHHHAIVITSNGTAFAWGKNDTGCCGRPYPPQLSMPVELHFAPSHDESTAGNPTTTPTKVEIFPKWYHRVDGEGGKAAPPKIPDDWAIVHACGGAEHSCFVTRSGRLFVCGSNREGQLGLSSSSSSDTTTTTKDDKSAIFISPAVPILHPEGRGGDDGAAAAFVAAEAGSCHTLLLDNKENVWQMGSDTQNTDGGLQCVLSGKKIISIAAGGDQSMAMAAGEGILRRRKFSIADDSATTAGTNKNTIPDSDVLANTLEELIESMVDHDNPSLVVEEVARGVEELLQNPAVLNSVFFDPLELDEMYQQLVSVGDAKTQQIIASAIETGIRKGLAMIAPENARMIYPEAVRCLLTYIRFLERPANEVGVAFDLQGKTISALMETILGLPFEGYKAFIQWATSLYSGELFVKMLVKPLIFQLDRSLRFTVDEDEVAHVSLSIGAVPLIVSVLQWLHSVSDKMDFAKFDDYYSTALDTFPTAALFDDLYQLKMAKEANQRPSTFLISSSPFLFSPNVKQNLLQIESQIEMFKMASADGGATIDPSTGSISGDVFFKLEIEREHMLEQTLDIIKTRKPSDLRKKLQVVFIGEEAIDAGGVTKEFFQLLSEELFAVSSGMWTDRFGDNVTWFNADCLWDIKGFELTGILVGLALYNSVLLDVHFPMAVYRKLLGYPLGLEDMVDEDLMKGFQQLLDYEGDDVEYIFCLNFEVTWTDDLGMEKRKELKPGGSEISVTSDNREEYVRLYTEWLLVDSIGQQWEAFEGGVVRIIEGLSLDLLFQPEELKLLVVGSPELDFDALEANTEYEAGYDESSPTIQNFWKFIKGLDRESQLNFLKFAAGSSMAPIGGLGALKFKIQRAGPDSPQLPTSHTCFNTLLLPDYDSYEKLEDRLSRAIVECEGFGLK